MERDNGGAAGRTFAGPLRKGPAGGSGRGTFFRPEIGRLGRFPWFGGAGLGFGAELCREGGRVLPDAGGAYMKFLVR